MVSYKLSHCTRINNCLITEYRQSMLQSLIHITTIINAYDSILIKNLMMMMSRVKYRENSRTGHQHFNFIFY